MGEQLREGRWNARDLGHPTGSGNRGSHAEAAVLRDGGGPSLAVAVAFLRVSDNDDDNDDDSDDHSCRTAADFGGHYSS